MLSGLSDALGSASAGADKTGNTPADMMARFIERNEATGKSHLKIPLPEPEVMQSVLSRLEKLFIVLCGRSEDERVGDSSRFARLHLEAARKN